MKKILFLLVLPFFSGFIFGTPKEDFDQIINFSLNLKRIQAYIDRGREGEIDSSRMIIIDGSIASMAVLDKEEETFKAELELINGEWKGLEAVEMYRCIVQFEGPEYKSYFPSRRRRRRSSSGNTLEVNSHVIVIARFKEVRTDPFGKVIGVLEGIEIRPLS